MGDRNQNRLSNGVEEEHDRLSDLPEALLLRILSPLPVRQIIRTGTLTKFWQYLWTLVPNLDFDTLHKDLYETHTIEEFVSIIDRTLSQSRVSKIDALSIQFFYSYKFASAVDSWIHFATRNNVEVLRLDFANADGNWYTLPMHLYTCSSLKILTLVQVEVFPILPIRWSSLASLSLDSADFDEEAIGRILSGCPVLEFLKFCRYHWHTCFKVTSPSLRELVLAGFDDWYDDGDDYDDDYYDGDAFLSISAPNLRVLRFSGEFCTRNILLEDISSLAVADLNFRISQVTDLVKCSSMLQGLFEKFRHVRELVLGTWCIQVLSVLEVKGWRSFPQLKCNILEVDMHIVKWDLPGIAKLLEMSPYLETLVISIDNYRCPQFYFGEEDFLAAYDFNEENYFSSQDWVPKWWFLHLKNVKILGFQNRVLECELVKFLLNNASVLEKMVIHENSEGLKCKSYGCKCDEKLVSTKRMMGFPRSSPRAVVLFPDSQ